MDAKVAERLDSITETQIAKSFRVCQFPDELQALLRDNDIKITPRIRFSKINPRRRGLIAEVVQRRYHNDLKSDILSDAQVFDLVKSRGEWSAEKKARMDELQLKTTREMGRLWANGLTPNTVAYSSQLAVKVREFLDGIEESDALTPEQKSEISKIFQRWYEYRKGKDYSEHAKAQGRETYSVDADWGWLVDHMPKIELGQLLSDMDELKDKQVDIESLIADRVELQELQLKHARIFAGTVESRQANAEEMAQLYFTCEQLDAADVPQGHLTKTFEDLFALPEDVIRWLMFESMFFHNDIADEARDYLSTFGFLKAERTAESETGPASAPSGESTPSDASPVPPNSSSDGASQDATASDSLELQPA